MKKVPLGSILLLGALFLLPGHSLAASCTGPSDQASCGAGNVCQQDSNGFYACFPAPAANGTCTGRDDASCGAGNSCQQDANGFYGCFPNASASSGLGGLSGNGTTNTGTTNTTSGTGSINTTALSGYKNAILTIINSILLPLLVAVAFIVFLWGVFNYFIRGAAEPEKRAEGAQFVLWGVLGFAIIFSVWGLVNLLMGTLNLTSTSLHPTYPTL